MTANERIETALDNKENFVITIDTQIIYMEEIEFTPEEIMDYDGKVISFANLLTGINMEVDVTNAIYNDEDDWVEGVGAERFAISFIGG